MIQQLLTPLLNLMWKSRGTFQDFIREEIVRALELNHDSQTFECLLRLTGALRAGGHITEDLNNE